MLSTSACLFAFVISSPPAAAQPTLVFPDSPDLDTAATEAALREVGVEVIPFAAAAAQLRGAAEAVRDGDGRRLAEIDGRLGAARTAYLEQRWEDAVRALDTVERDYLDLLGRAEHRELLWQVQTQRGLTHLARGGKRDREQADARFALALAIDHERRITAAMHGPVAAAAFADVDARRSTQAPRPIAVSVSPPAALVAVDGRHSPRPSSAISLSPGLHVFHAVAPGYRAAAVLVDLTASTRVTLSLAPDDGIASLASLWATNRLSLAAAETQRSLSALAAAAGAARVVAIVASDSGARALVLSRTGGPQADWTFADSAPRAAVRALGDAATIVARKPARPSSPIWERWWFWTAAASTLAISASAVYLVTRDSDQRFRIFGQRP